jgi:HK97 family phage major capsid protein
MGLYTRTEYSRGGLADEVLEAIKSGALRGMSFTGAFLRSDKPGPFYARSDGSLELVTRLEIGLLEYGPTPIPTYEEAEVLGARSARLPDPDGREQITLPLVLQRSELDDPERVHDTSTSDESAAAGHTTEGDSEQGTDEGQGTPTQPPAADDPPADDPSEPQGETTVADDATTDPGTMTVAERSTRLDEIRSRMQEIDTQHPGELPAEIQTEWDALDTEEKTHQRAIQAATARRERLAAMASQQTGNGGGETVDAQRAGFAGAPAVHVRNENIYDLAALRQRARSLDDLPGLYRENAYRAVERARYPGLHSFRGMVSVEDAQEHIRMLLDGPDDEDGTLARRILVTGSPEYERAFYRYLMRGSMAGLTAGEQRALSMGASDSAKLAVPFTLDPTVILTSDGSTNPLRAISRVETITGRAWEGVTSAGITVGRSGEAAEVDDDAPTLAQPTVTPTRVDGFVPFSIESDQDWPRLRSEMTRLLQDAKDQEEASSFVTGSGTGNNPEGISAGLATTSNVADGFTSFEATDLYAVENALPPRFQPRARWLGRKNTYNLVRALDTSGGGSLWVRLGPGIPGELIGYPAHEASAMPTRTTATNRYLILGDFNHFLIVDKAGMDVELVPHLFSTGNNRPSGQRGLLAFWRNNSAILVDNAFRGLTYSTT